MSGFVVNADLSSACKLAGDGALRQRPYRMVAGVALSLLVHAVLLFGWRHKQSQLPADTHPPPRAIAVWLRPLPPPPPVLPPEPPKVVQAMPKPPAARQARAARRPAPSTEVIAIPEAERETPAAPDSFTVRQPADAAPRFDPDAAKKFARQIAGDPDPARAGTAVGQIPPKPLETETKAARAIASAKRRDCKDGVPGGLLAPLFLLMDKKDSGCKW